MLQFNIGRIITLCADVAGVSPEQTIGQCPVCNLLPLTVDFKIMFSNVCYKSSKLQFLLIFQCGV